MPRIPPRRWALFALALLTAAVPDAGCRRGDESQLKRIIVLTNGNSPFWDAARQGMQEAAKDLRLADAGLRAVMEVNDATPQGQLDKLRQFASQSDVVGVAVSALDANNAQVAEEMGKLRLKGVHVVTIDADVDRAKFRDVRRFYIGTDNLSGGKELGAAARGLLEARSIKSGSYVQFVGRTGAHNAIERMDGFKGAIGESYREADRMADGTDRTRARENVRNAMRNHPDLVALVGIWSYNAPAIVDVVEQEEKREAFTVVAFDAEPDAVRQMGEGMIDAMVVQNPFEMGYQSVRALKAMHEKDEKTLSEMFPRQGESDGDLYDTGLKVVVPSKESPLKREMFGEKTQFMELAEFKGWLAKYGLQGS
jgi:ribose transport system substrate-binding protein